MCDRTLKVSFVHLAGAKNQAKACLGTLLFGLGVIYVRNIVEGKYGASSIKVRSELDQIRKFMYNQDIPFTILFCM